MQNYDKKQISAANKVKTDVIHTGLDKYTNPTHVTTILTAKSVKFCGVCEL